MNLQIQINCLKLNRMNVALAHTIVCDVVDDDDAIGSAIISSSDGAEPFLSCRSLSHAEENVCLTLSRIPAVSHCGKRGQRERGGGEAHNSAQGGRSTYNLQLYGLPLEVYCLDLEVHTDGAQIAICERVLCKAEEQT